MLILFHTYFDNDGQYNKLDLYVMITKFKRLLIYIITRLKIKKLVGSLWSMRMSCIVRTLIILLIAISQKFSRLMCGNAKLTFASSLLLREMLSG